MHLLLDNRCSLQENDLYTETKFCVHGMAEQWALSHKGGSKLRVRDKSRECPLGGDPGNNKETQRILRK